LKVPPGAVTAKLVSWISRICASVWKNTAGQENIIGFPRDPATAMGLLLKIPPKIRRAPAHECVSTLFSGGKIPGICPPRGVHLTAVARNGGAPNDRLNPITDSRTDANRGWFSLRVTSCRRVWRLLSCIGTRLLRQQDSANSKAKSWIRWRRSL